MAVCPEWTLAWVNAGDPAMTPVACNRVVPDPVPLPHEGKHTASASGKTFAWWHGTSEDPPT